MSDASFTETIKTTTSPSEIIDKISRVSDWWAKDFQGKSKDIGDEFTVRFGSGDTFTIKVAEIIPDKKVAWDVIDANQGWVKEPKEWVGTIIVWDIAETNDATEVLFTHSGLAPKLECYGTCAKAWDYLIQQSFAELLSTGKGLPA